MWLNFLQNGSNLCSHRKRLYPFKSAGRSCSHGMVTYLDLVPSRKIAMCVLMNGLRSMRATLGRFSGARFSIALINSIRSLLYVFGMAGNCNEVNEICNNYKPIRNLYLINICLWICVYFIVGRGLDRHIFPITVSSFDLSFTTSVQLLMCIQGSPSGVLGEP